jgi:hypothetical protein
VTEGSSWHRPHGAEILADVLAPGAVAACRALEEGAVFVHQGHGEAVHLRLADQGEVVAFHEAGDALIPGAKLLRAEGVTEAQERHAVLDDAERLDRRAGDALRRRVGRDQLREALLDAAQLAY